MYTGCVFKEVICPDGSEEICPAPSDFTINVAGNNPMPSSFPGSSMGTPVSVEPGMYEVTEVAPATPPGLIVQPPEFSPDCTRDIVAGQDLSCSITNQFVSDTINVGTFPLTLEFSPATDNIYVANGLRHRNHYFPLIPLRSFLLDRSKRDFVL